MNEFQPAPVEERATAEERRIKLHGPADFEGMRKAGRLAAEVLDFITPHVVPGVTTDALDRLCHGFIVNVQKAYPAPLNYDSQSPNVMPYPKSICTSVNNEICHGIPGQRILKDGD